MTATKTKVMSLMTIERVSTPGVAASKDGPARPPVTEQILPYTLFLATPAEIKDLKSHDAITDETDRFKEARIDQSLVEDAEDDGEAQAAAQKAADAAAKAAKDSKPTPTGNKPVKDIVG